jgi:KaiC/GvpD/RAD55 family RecA-like ATPase
VRNRMPEDVEDRMRRNGHVPDVVGIRASEVITKPVEWLWDKRIPKGKLTMFDGDPDVGKSVVTMDLAARVSTGRGFPDGATCDAGNVLIVNVEDAKDDTVVPRLKAHGADLERIVVIDGMPDEKGGTRLLDLPDDVPSLRNAVKHYEASLLIIDPVITMLGGDVYKDSDARKALAPLRDMAEATGVTIVAVRHLNKNTSLSAIQRGGGNMGLIGVARAGAFFAYHPEQDGLRVMAPHKSNLAEKQPSLQYVIKGWAIDENIGRVEWRGITEHDANSLATDNLSPHEKTRLEEAKEFLYEELKDAPMWARQIYRDSNDAGIAKRTLDSAKSVMRIRSEKVGTEGWMWSLPDKRDTHHDVRDLRDLRDVQNDDRSDTAYIKEGCKGREGRNGVEDRDLQRNVPLSADEEDDDVRRLVDEGRTESDALAGVIEQLEMILELPGEAGWDEPEIRERVAKLKKRQERLPRNGHLLADEGNKRVQALIDQGMSEKWAIAEVLGRGSYERGDDYVLARRDTRGS